MGHYAKVSNNKVVQVIVAEAEFFNTFIDSSPGIWLQTSYNTYGGQHKLSGTPLRYNYAGIGYDYDPIKDAFIPPKPPVGNWELDENTCLWVNTDPAPLSGNP